MYYELGELIQVPYWERREVTVWILNKEWFYRNNHNHADHLLAVCEIIDEIESQIATIGWWAGLEPYEFFLPWKWPGIVSR